EEDRQAEEQWRQRKSRNRDMDRKDETHRLPEVVVDPASKPDRFHYRAKIVVEHNDGRCLASDVGAAPAHRDADVRGLERRGVVDPVTGHRDDLAVCLQRLDDAQLLLREDPRKDGRGTYPTSK